MLESLSTQSEILTEVDVRGCTNLPSQQAPATTAPHAVIFRSPDEPESATTRELAGLVQHAAP